MRVFLVLLDGRDGTDPLFLQIKQAGPSVYEAYCGESRHANHGERVVVGKRLIQSATDIFVGFTSVGGDDFYVRQFRDMKVIPRADLVAPRLAEFATASGKVLARAHARTGDPIAIDAYIGKGRAIRRGARGVRRRLRATRPLVTTSSSQTPSRPERSRERATDSGESLLP